MDEWRREQTLNSLRKSYIYARSASQRALVRATEGTPDALFETVWWIGVCNSYLYTILPNQWKAYKRGQPWADLIDGIYWARNQTLHDPLAVAAVEIRWQIVDGVHTRHQQSRWAKHSDIPIAKEENNAYAESYRKALEGRVMIETLAEAVEAIRRVSIDVVAGFQKEARGVGSSDVGTDT